MRVEKKDEEKVKQMAERKEELRDENGVVRTENKLAA